MNWNSKAVSEVAKERIWKEHVANEGNKRQIFDTFRVNPFELSRVALPEPINKRATRFLDREKAFLDTISKRTGVKLPELTAKKAEPTRREDGGDDLSTLMAKLHQSPRQKYHQPLTSSQELGWNPAGQSRNKMFDHSLHSCDITRTQEILRK